jgi:hypothetical protein
MKRLTVEIGHLLGRLAISLAVITIGTCLSAGRATAAAPEAKEMKEVKVEKIQKADEAKKEMKEMKADSIKGILINNENIRALLIRRNVDSGSLLGLDELLLEEEID